MALKSKMIIVIAAVAAMSAGFWLSSSQNDGILMSSDKANEAALAEARKKFSPIQGLILDPARIITVPTLKQDDGTDFTLESLQGDWHLIFFGYTHCPDICPVTMSIAAQAKKLAAEKNQSFPQVVFISVDPERDKVEMLTEYVQYFDKDFIGVTGENDLIKALTLQMSVVYMKMAPQNEDKESDKGYLVDHSSALLLLNPEGKLVAFLHPPHEPEIILKDINKVKSL